LPEEGYRRNKTQSTSTGKNDGARNSVLAHWHYILCYIFVGPLADETVIRKHFPNGGIQALMSISCPNGEKFGSLMEAALTKQA
jgi:hypothetical protein